MGTILEEINGLVDLLTRPEIEELATIIDNDLIYTSPSAYDSVDEIYNKVIELVRTADTLENEIEAVNEFEEYVKSKFY